MSTQKHTTPPRHCVVTIERFGRNKYDCVLFLDDRVIERTAFPTMREATQFVRLMQRAGHQYMPPASGGSGSYTCPACGETTSDWFCPVCGTQVRGPKPARGGAPARELPFDYHEEHNGPIGFSGGEYIWPDYGYPPEGSMRIDVEVASIDLDDIPF